MSMEGQLGQADIREKQRRIETLEKALYSEREKEMAHWAAAATGCGGLNALQAQQPREREPEVELACDRLAARLKGLVDSVTILERRLGSILSPCAPDTASEQTKPSFVCPLGGKLTAFQIEIDNVLRRLDSLHTRLEI